MCAHNASCNWMLINTCILKTVVPDKNRLHDEMEELCTCLCTTLYVQLSLALIGNIKCFVFFFSKEFLSSGKVGNN